MRWTGRESLLVRILAVVGAGSTAALACESVESELGAGGSSGPLTPPLSGSAAGSGGGGASSSAGSFTAAGGEGSLFGVPSSGGFVTFGTGGIIGTDPPLRDGGLIASDAGVGTYRVDQARPTCGAPYVLASAVVPGRDHGTLCSPSARMEYEYDYVCLAAPPPGKTCANTYDIGCVGQIYQCGYSKASYVCGPAPAGDGDANTGQCCYVLAGNCIVGRPLIVASAARLAMLEPREDWLRSGAPDVSRLDAETRTALAEAYARDGLHEHASVASFARFALHCLSLGAPPSIVRAAQQAGAEEVEHARLAFGLASAYAGQPLGPGALDIAGALDGPADPAAIAASVAREGCVAETVSALLIAAARDAAEDPAVRAALTAVAREEEEHALLAWRYVRWALGWGDAAVRRALEEAFARAEEWVGFGAVTSLPGSAGAMRAHGYLPVDERRRVAADAVRKVVLPAARALLGGSFSGAGLSPCARA